MATKNIFLRIAVMASVFAMMPTFAGQQVNGPKFTIGQLNFSNLPHYSFRDNCTNYGGYAWSTENAVIWATCQDGQGGRKYSYLVIDRTKLISQIYNRDGKLSNS